MKQFNFLILLIIVGFLSLIRCSNQKEQTLNQTAILDSLNFAVKGNFKIKIVLKDKLLLFDLYKKKRGEWIYVQHHQEETNLKTIQLDFFDFNDDGFTDFSVKTNYHKKTKHFSRGFFLFDTSHERMNRRSEDTLEPEIIYAEETESFKDSLNIGLKSKFKIELERIVDDSGAVFVEVNLFKLKNKKWKSIQLFKVQKDGISSLKPDISDFNKDDFNDIAFQTATAARGANVVKTIYLFDKRKEKLILLKNSDNYPNIQYNKELDCLDAHLTYAGSSTVFLKIRNYSLIPFAEVSTLNGNRTVSLIDQNGVYKEIRNEQLNTQKFDGMRYSNFDPLTFGKQ